MDSGEHPVALTQQAMKDQQGQGWLCRVGVYDNVTESTEVLVAQTRSRTIPTITTFFSHCKAHIKGHNEDTV